MLGCVAGGGWGEVGVGSLVIQVRLSFTLPVFPSWGPAWTIPASHDIPVWGLSYRNVKTGGPIFLSFSLSGQNRTQLGKWNAFSLPYAPIQKGEDISQELCFSYLGF